MAEYLLQRPRVCTGGKSVWVKVSAQGASVLGAAGAPGGTAGRGSGKGGRGSVCRSAVSRVTSGH